MKYFSIILIVFVFADTIISQDTQQRFKRLSTADGLSNNWIRCIYKDDIGFMWFGTADGLCRYDGNEFKIYRPKLNNGSSLGDIGVSDIIKKDANELWVCTHLGVYIYNYKNDDIQPFPLIKNSVVLCALEDKEKKLWFGTNKGLYRFDPSTKKIILYTYNQANPLSLSNSYVNVLFE